MLPIIDVPSVVDRTISAGIPPQFPRLSIGTAAYHPLHCL
jgi:hypothetical protein